MYGDKTYGDETHGDIKNGGVSYKYPVYTQYLTERERFYVVPPRERMQYA